jgi:2-succinyl-6-hydroxy-2,4-cyclohexadiene-1-carboxylate synthase
MPSYWTQLSRVDVPVLLMAGAEDVKYRRTARRMAELLPRATVEIVASAGHNLLLEAPGRVAAALARRGAATFNSFC